MSRTGAGGPAPVRVFVGMKMIILFSGRAFVGDVVVDDPRFLDLVWSEETRDGNGAAHSINVQAHIPRETIKIELEV